MNDALDPDVTVGYNYRMYEVVYHKDAVRSLRKIPCKLAQMIQEKIASVAVDPHGRHGNVAKLRGREGYRLRVGDWRVIYEIEDDRMLIQVVRIAAHGDVCKE